MATMMQAFVMQGTGKVGFMEKPFLLIGIAHF